MDTGAENESDSQENGRSGFGSFVVKGDTIHGPLGKYRQQLRFLSSRLQGPEKVMNTEKTSFVKKSQSSGSGGRALIIKQLAKFLTKRNYEWLHGIYRNPVRLKRAQAVSDKDDDAPSSFKIRKTRRFYNHKSSFKNLRRKLLAMDDNRVKSEHNQVISSGSEKGRNTSVVLSSENISMTDVSKNVTSEEHEEEVFTIRHRLRNNEDAMWGLACVSFILILLLWAVWFSGLCKQSRETLVHAEYSSSIQRMSVREMLKNRAKFLPIFRRFHRKQKRDDEIPLIDDVMAADPDDGHQCEQSWESLELPS